MIKIEDSVIKGDVVAGKEIVIDPASATTKAALQILRVMAEVLNELEAIKNRLKLLEAKIGG